ncbi:opine dehydrogenase [Acinetobacter calcoaceticus]
MKIAILGTGNAGCALAAKYTQQGHIVSLIKTSKSLHEENFNVISQQQGIWLHDLDDSQKFIKIFKITRDIKDGLQDAEMVIILTQSIHHESVAEKISDLIPDTCKIIFTIPGNLGSLYLYKKIGSKVIYAEGESTPYDARLEKPGVVKILFKNRRNAVSFLPKSKADEGLKYISTLVDTYKFKRQNLVESALHNPNLVVHTIGVIMSASRIEMMKGEFWMYKESFSPAIWNLINELDAEKNMIIEAFKGEKLSYLDACKFRNADDLSMDSYEVFKGYAETGGPKGPDSLETRYLHEDVANGLCLLSMLGKLLNIETPVTNSLITIASSLVQYNFTKNARTLDNLGLGHLNTEQLVEFFN